MPRRSAPRWTRRAILIPPREHCWVESDAYDRAAFANLLADAPTLAAVREAGLRLVPHFDALLEDVFCLLFKMQPVLRPGTAVAQSAALNGILLRELQVHPTLEHLRTRTQLDEGEAGLAALLIGEDLLTLLRQERLLPRGDLLDLWTLQHEEDTLRSRGEEIATLDRRAEKGDEQVTRAREETAHSAEVTEARIRQKAKHLEQRLREMSARARTALPLAAAGVTRQLSEASEAATSWGRGLGAGGRNSPGRQLELGRRLATNTKLKKLAALVGRMRQQALALRRQTLERANEEIFDVQLGRELAHLLPPELLALRHPILRRDFHRRLIEGRLLSYALRGVDDRGRGPMIVCLDGSSSMAGEKEIWSKAVALTLLEIARRQRRLFRFLCFSSSDTPLFQLDLNPRERYEVQVDRALEVAEYFPGGGTDFETPLDAALACLRQARFRRGDIVLITDGECQVSPTWLERFRNEKSRLRFSLFSVLIDVGPTALETVRALSDRVTNVSRLTDEGVRDLFVAL